MQLARLDPRRQASEQMQVLLRRVGVPAEVEQGVAGENQAGLFVRFAQSRFARGLAGMDAALRQVPVALAGDMAEQQLAGLQQDDDAATEAAPAKWRETKHRRISVAIGARRATGRAAWRPRRQLLDTEGARATSAQPSRRRLSIAHVASRHYAFFPTAIGDCAIAWNDVGLTGVWLPAATRAALQRRVRASGPDAIESVPAGAVAEIVEAITRLLAGEHVDFADVRLDLGDTGDFDARVYAVTRAIPAGSVLTYGEVAARVGTGAAARDVGQSLGRNPWPIVVPCHRVVAAGNALGGFSAPGGTATKRRLLAIERARRASAVPDLFDASPGEAADEGCLRSRGRGSALTPRSRSRPAT